MAAHEFRHNICPFFSLLFWCDGSMRMRIRGFAGELCPYTIQKRLCPLLPDFVEASLLKIIWSHDDSEFDTRVESQKPGLGKGGNL